MGEDRPDDGDMDAIAARWPAWNARIAQFLMDDPLRVLREQLQDTVTHVGPQAPQRELFA